MNNNAGVQTSVVELSQFPWGILLMVGIVTVVVITIRMLLK